MGTVRVATASKGETIMKAWLYRFWVREDGQDLIEYALLATVISLAGMLGVQALSTAIANVFTIISDQPRIDSRTCRKSYGVLGLCASTGDAATYR